MSANAVHSLRRLLRTLCAALAVAALPSVAHAQSAITPGAPVDHFRLYGFDKDNGWRNWQLEGAKAEFAPDGAITITNMRLHIFEPDGTQTVKLFIQSPVANMAKDHSVISGPDTIVLTSKGVYLGGQDWSWYPATKRLVIRNHTHTVIEGEIGPILE